MHQGSANVNINYTFGFIERTLNGEAVSTDVPTIFRILKVIDNF